MADSGGTRPATLADYVSLARPDHWFKNVFMLPGLALAMAVGAEPTVELVWAAPAGFLAVCLIASANYTINEWLDRAFDAFHPMKKERAAVAAAIDGRLVYAQWALLAGGGLALAAAIRVEFLVSALALLVMGVLYNVRPVRTKDRAYLDVLSESLNNPIRFLLGWFLLEPVIVVPSSILVSYWFGGAYLMAVKRYAEYRTIGDPERAGLYRRSFRYYTESRLMISAVVYAIFSATLLGVFMTKYKIEFIFMTPLVAVLFGWYLHIGMRKDSIAQTPEKLYRERRLWAFIVVIGCATVALFYIEMPDLEILLSVRRIGAP